MIGYNSLIWIRDEEGKEYYCPVESVREDFKDGNELNERERAACSDVSQIVGTERW
jgi:hypothetical protein